MIRTTVDDARTNLRDLIAAAPRGEEAVIVTDNDGRERAIQLVAIPAHPDVPRKREFGSAKGQVWTTEDFNDPSEDLEEHTRQYASSRIRIASSGSLKATHTSAGRLVT
jgi:antitoxin (DNA-binding transcriptional repressor) of toxin-antitoxin stability system